MKMLNIGCGQTPTKGWINYDNSISIRLSKFQWLPNILYKLRIIDVRQYQFINFARTSDIQYLDGTKRIPMDDNSCNVIYSSHMLEHLDRKAADRFLEEAFRVLCSGGVLRIAVPDISIHVSSYMESGDADKFIQSTLMCVPTPSTFMEKLKYLVSGSRHHVWMYDGESLSKLLSNHGFEKINILPAGETIIPDSGELNLFERQHESVYVESIKP